QALVHRIDGNRRGKKLVAILEQRNFRLVCDAAEEKTVCWFLAFEQGQRGLVEIPDDTRGLLLPRRSRFLRHHFRDGEAFTVGIGIRQRPFDPSAAKDDDKAMFFSRFDDDLRAADLFDLLREQPAKLLALLLWHPPRGPAR